MTTRACSNSRRSSASSFPTDFTATLRFPTNCAAATSVGSRVDAVKCPNCQNESCNQSILGPSIAASGGPVRPGDFLSILLSIGRQGGRAAREMAASGRGCVKTQNRPLEIVSKLGKFSVEVSCLLTARYRPVSQSIACHVVFEGDFWGEKVVEF